ncbi:hypothetical protein QTP88_010675 [Uroleucon formosanum]
MKKKQTFLANISLTFSNLILICTEHLERIKSFIDSPLPMSLPAKHTSPSEIKFLIKNRTYTVRYGNSVSSFYPIKAGVPQCSDLSLDLFNVYTADIPKTPNTVMATYADDTAILSPNNDPVKTVHFLQKHLDLIDKWSSNWKIKINPDKSIYVPFTLKKLNEKYFLTYAQPLTSDSIEQMKKYLPGVFKLCDELPDYLINLEFPSFSTIRTEIEEWKGPLSFSSKWNPSQFINPPNYVPPDFTTLKHFNEMNNVTFSDPPFLKG